MRRVNFSIVGGSGFRAQYYFRIAQALPHLFHISGAVVRNEENGRKIEEKWKTKTYRTLDALLETENPDFVVVSVSWEDCPKYLFELSERNIPALAETPPAPDLEGLLLLHEELTKKDAKVQVAEQYQFHPIQQARSYIINSGRLGQIREASVSISHFYHGVSLLRKMLGVSFDEAEITGTRFMTKVIEGPGRAGYPIEEKLIEIPRDLVWIDFGEKLGIYDFTKDQHRSWIRSNYMSIRGERGEIVDDHINMITDYKTPVHLDLKRINKGELENQEGYFLYGIMAGEAWTYINHFAPARLYDDEIGIAECLKRMAEYVQGGPSFYSIAEASQDHYLGMLMEKAINSGEKVKAVKQPWADIK